LQAGGIDILTDGNCYILHHKVILIDEQIVITESYNVTKSAERDNDENVVIIDGPALARAYLDECQRVLRACIDSAALQGEQRGSPSIYEVSLHFSCTDNAKACKRHVERNLILIIADDD